MVPGFVEPILRSQYGSAVVEYTLPIIVALNAVKRVLAVYSSAANLGRLEMGKRKTAFQPFFYS
jgi:hypothetical protein